MATQAQERTSYPSIPAKAWWTVRRRFQQSVPSRVDAGYFQSVLNVQEGHAANLVPPFRAVGLIDDNGKPTPLANDWRSDDTYAKACETMLKDIYPTSLLDAVPPSDKDKEAAKRWFSRELRVGEAAAMKMAAFYVLLSEADPNIDAAKGTTTTTPRAVTPTKRATVRERGQPQQPRQPQSEPDPARVEPPRAADPSLHIDIQVHIPSDASPEQIDSIFASMAKHLYRRS